MPDPGVISGRSAARWHGLKRVAPPNVPEVTVARGHTRAPAGAVVRISRDLPAQDIVKVGPLRYTSLARTVCDLADGDNPWETLAILDDAIALGARPQWIHQRAVALVNGRSGVALLRDATDPHAAPAFRSWLERTFAGVCRTARLPEPQWNVPVRDSQGLIGIVDALWHPWPVIAETEGMRFHTTPEQRRQDAERFNRLADAGYAVRRFTWEDVVQRPARVAQSLSKALQAAGAPTDQAATPACFPPPQTLNLTTVGR